MPTPPNFAEFSDPRLVAVYDSLNPIDADTRDFYLDLAASLEAETVLDVGCGTGLLTVHLAAQGHRVIGVDPAAAMLKIAWGRRYDSAVTFIEGDATRLGEEGADLAIMTGHVAQFFLADDAWQATLRAIHRALRPGGVLAFESRNPLAEGWTRWTEDATRRTVDDPAAGRVEMWFEVTRVEGPVIYYELHYRFQRTGETLVAHNALIFRPQAAITRSVEQAGFAVKNVFGDWDRRPVSADSPELIVVAARTTA